MEVSVVCVQMTAFMLQVERNNQHIIWVENQNKKTLLELLSPLKKYSEGTTKCVNMIS